MAWSFKKYSDDADTIAAKNQRDQVAKNKPGEFTYADYAESDAVKNAQSALKNHEANKPGEFTYADYQESDLVKNAYAALQQHMANKPGEYQSQWLQGLNDTMNKIMNREKFSYDLNGDMLYQQYKDQYTTQGNLAMQDTMGQAAAMTGGYGNSYAQSVGQQTYQGYLQQLNDKVPELYKLALDQYNRETDDLYNQYGLYADRDDRDYSRYRDDVSDWQVDRDYLTGRYDTEADRDYGRYTNERDFAYGQHRDTVADWQTERNYLADQYNNERNWDYSLYTDGRDFAYGQHRDSVADWQYDLSRADGIYNTAKQISLDKYNNDRNLSYTKYTDERAFNEQQRHNKLTEAAAWTSANKPSSNTSLFGGFSEKEFTDAMRDAAERGSQKDAKALVTAAGNTDAAMEIYHSYFGEQDNGESHPNGEVSLGSGVYGQTIPLKEPTFVFDPKTGKWK